MTLESIGLATFTAFLTTAACRFLRGFWNSDKIEVIEVRRCNSNNPAWWWRQVARNGEIVCYSETFDNVSNARRAAEAQACKLGVKVVDHTKEKA